jgi:methylated-DNA-[protein]-cysteine S-methyltransferase
MILEAVKVVDSPLGKISIAATSRGVAHLEIMPAASRPKEFSDSAKASEILASASLQLEEYFAKKRKDFDLPLDLVGTEFQRSVWKELLNIEFGETLSYGEVAQAVSKPLAARAVGGAVGANPVPIIIPCHRVMGSTGKLTGYSATGGVATKTKLLKLEGVLE